MLHEIFQEVFVSVFYLFSVHRMFMFVWYFLSNSHAHARWTLHQTATPPRLSLYNLFNNRQKYCNKRKFSLIFARQVSYSLTLIYPFDDSASFYMMCSYSKACNQIAPSQTMVLRCNNCNWNDLQGILVWITISYSMS